MKPEAWYRWRLVTRKGGIIVDSSTARGRKAAMSDARAEKAARDRKGLTPTRIEVTRA